MAGHEQHQRLVLDVVLERQRRVIVVRAAEQQRAVPAVQEVGVATVLRVHLHEAAAVAGVGAVELGTAALGAGEREGPEVETGLAERERDGGRCGAAVR